MSMLCKLFQLEKWPDYLSDFTIQFRWFCLKNWSESEWQRSSVVDPLGEVQVNDTWERRLQSSFKDNASFKIRNEVSKAVYSIKFFTTRALLTFIFNYETSVITSNKSCNECICSLCDWRLMANGSQNHIQATNNIVMNLQKNPIKWCVRLAPLNFLTSTEDTVTK